MNVQTTYGDGTFFRRTGAIETGKSDHRVGDSIASSLATTSTTEADGILPVQLSVIVTDKSVDWAGNLVVELSNIGAADDSPNVRSDCQSV